MNDKEWQLFTSQFSEDDRQMLQDLDFQNKVLDIYAGSESQEEAHAQIKELIKIYKLKEIEVDLWSRTHPLQKLRIYLSCIMDKIKYKILR